MAQIIDLDEDEGEEKYGSYRCMEADACRAALAELFPDMCPEFLNKAASDNYFFKQRAVDYVLDLIQEGKGYDKRPKASSLKRKRSDSPPVSQEGLLIAKYDNPARRGQVKDKLYLMTAKNILASEFPRMSKRDINPFLAAHNSCLFPAYLALDKMVLAWQSDGDSKTPYKMKKTPTAPDTRFFPANIDDTIRKAPHLAISEALVELQAARRIRDAAASKRDLDKAKKRKEEENFARAQAEGTASECECCFGDFAMNRMVHCDAREKHWFCVECARRNAETAVGLSKYELLCMSVAGCSGGFANGQRQIFLNDKLTAALDRIEYEAVLRIAGIENLERCPFCPYAAEYPPVEEDKEFRCGNDDCLVVSCRLCKEETHIPKTCEEAAKENGVSARRQIEEAMSAALIRKCNKCNTPFIKEYGCNKMICSRQGCNNVQCYVCSKSCDYGHFNDEKRGGKKGNCPLFEDQEERHDNEVRNAEKAARKKVVEENPSIGEEYLKFNMSKKVVDDDDKKRRNHNHYAIPQPIPIPIPAQYLPPNLPFVLPAEQQQYQQHPLQNQPMIGQPLVAVAAGQPGQYLEAPPFQPDPQHGQAHQQGPQRLARRAGYLEAIGQHMEAAHRRFLEAQRRVAAKPERRQNAPRQWIPEEQVQALMQRAGLNNPVLRQQRNVPEGLRAPLPLEQGPNPLAQKRADPAPPNHARQMPMVEAPVNVAVGDPANQVEREKMANSNAQPQYLNDAIRAVAARPQEEAQARALPQRRNPLR